MTGVVLFLYLVGVKRKFKTGSWYLLRVLFKITDEVKFLKENIMLSCNLQWNGEWGRAVQTEKTFVSSGVFFENNINLINLLASTFLYGSLS